MRLAFSALKLDIIAGRFSATVSPTQGFARSAIVVTIEARRVAWAGPQDLSRRGKHTV
ncbi:MAG TPA: hypothetical protein VM163_13565 [bacterium]|nr:hypothetical protein [bacterium]